MPPNLNFICISQSWAPGTVPKCYLVNLALIVMFCCIEFQENLRQNLIKNDLLFLHFDFSVFRFFFALFSICFLSPSHNFIFLPDKIRIVKKIIKFRIYCVFFVICRRFNIFFVLIVLRASGLKATSSEA